MTTTFTPGPWFTSELLSNVYYGNKNCEMIAQCGGFHFKQKPEGESEANARLIAAAPDLLGALEACAEKFRFYAEHHSDKGDFQKAINNTHMAMECEEVIAKATGSAA